MYGLSKEKKKKDEAEQKKTVKIGKIWLTSGRKNGTL